MDGPALLRLGSGLVVHRLSQQVEDAAQGAAAHGDGDGAAGIHGLHPTHQTVGAGPGDAAGHVVAHMLGHLQGDGLLSVLHRDGVEQLGQLAVGELDVQHRANDLDHGANVLFVHIQTPSCKRIFIKGRLSARGFERPSPWRRPLYCSAPPTISVISWVMAA